MENVICKWLLNLAFYGKKWKNLGRDGALWVAWRCDSLRPCITHSKKMYFCRLNRD